MEPLFEMCLSCDNLMCASDGRPPNSFVKISMIMADELQWRMHGQTEVVDGSSNPFYLTTISFSQSSGVSMNSRIRLSVYDVRERMTDVMTLLGRTTFTVSQIANTEGNRLRLPLTSIDNIRVGFITVQAWQLDYPADDSDSLLLSDVPGVSNGVFTDASPSGSNLSTQVHADIAAVNAASCNVETLTNSDNKKPSAHNLEIRPPSFSVMAPLSPRSPISTYSLVDELHAHIFRKTFRFPSGLGAEISVHEYMSESLLCFYLPCKVLQVTNSFYLSCLTFPRIC